MLTNVEEMSEAANNWKKEHQQLSLHIYRLSKGLNGKKTNTTEVSEVVKRMFLWKMKEMGNLIKFVVFSLTSLRYDLRQCKFASLLAKI